MSLLDRQISVIKSVINCPVTIIGGYHAEMLKNKGDNLILNPKFNSTNMIWSLFCAESELEGDVIVSYGDIVYSRKILQALLKSDSDISITIDLNWEKYWRLRNEDPLDDAETLKIDKMGYIKEIGQKPSSLDEVQGQYMGLMKFTQKGLDMMKNAYKNAIKSGFLMGKDIKNAYMTDMLQHLIQEGSLIKGVKITEDWVEVDTVSDLQSTITFERLSSIAAEINTPT
jgi:choline kinase